MVRTCFACQSWDSRLWSLTPTVFLSYRPCFQRRFFILLTSNEVYWKFNGFFLFNFRGKIAPKVSFACFVPPNEFEWLISWWWLWIYGTFSQFNAHMLYLDSRVSVVKKTKRQTKINWLRFPQRLAHDTSAFKYKHQLYCRKTQLSDRVWIGLHWKLWLLCLFPWAIV